MNLKIRPSTPPLRFPEFKGEWPEAPISKYVKRTTDQVSVEADKTYREIGVRSHGRGIFHKEPVLGRTLGNKRVFNVHPNAFVVNIVFAWEQAIALTTENEKGLIASHRFPMYVPRDAKVHLPFLLSYFKRKWGKHLLGLASPGGAGRNKTLGQTDFVKLTVRFPEVDEQEKIAAFLDAVDEKIAQLEKKGELLTQYKKGVMQKIFTQQIRFKEDTGNEFPDWEEKTLGDFCRLFKGKGISRGELEAGGTLECITYGELYTKYGAVIESADSRTQVRPSELFLSKAGDVIIPASGESAIDIATCACVLKDGVALGGDLNIIRGDFDGRFLSYYLRSAMKLALARLAQGVSVVHLYGAQLKLLRLKIPASRTEQEKIADFLMKLDRKIGRVRGEIMVMQDFKKGLLQRMFV